MMKKILVFLIVALAAFDVSAATKQCIIENYKNEKEYNVYNAYNTEINGYYSTATKKTHYTSIKCKKYLVLKTPGDPAEISTNDYNIHSGLGFSYGPIIVEEQYSCTGTIQYRKIVCEYLAADASTKTAMESELAAYKRWTNTDMKNDIERLVSSTTNLTTVKIDMITGESEDMSTAVKNKLKENEATVLTNSKLASVEKKVENKYKLNKSEIDGNAQSEVIQWHKVYTIQRTYYPVQKQIVLDGNSEGDVLSINTPCPTTSTCKALTGNKVYTDFSMGAGVHNLRVTATWGSLSLVSDCGYVIYNEGVEGWYDLLNYRQVDPSKPFPTGAHGLWASNTNLFGKEFQNSPITTFSLNATLIPDVRSYNKSLGVYKVKKPSNTRYSSDFLQKYDKYYNPAVLKG